MEKMVSVCKNPWCKAHFYYTESDMIEIDNEKVPPMECNKCRSFDTELSGGVTWTEKKYEGSRYDGLAHPMSMDVSKYVDRKRW